MFVNLSIHSGLLYYHYHLDDITDDKCLKKNPMKSLLFAPNFKKDLKILEKINCVHLLS